MGRQAKGVALIGQLWSCKLTVTMLACQGCCDQDISFFSHNLVRGRSVL